MREAHNLSFYIYQTKGLIMDVHPIENWLEEAEEAQEIPVIHRVAKVALAGIAGVLATWATERLYDRVRDRNENDTEKEELEC